MTSPIEIVSSLPEVAKAVYSDVASNTLQEIGKIGVDAVKTFRLALFPLQISAALQDRLAFYINSAIRAVPQERRISPQQSLALSICDQLKFCDEVEGISRLYVELLSRAMDKERVGEAHPAFVNIISQLAPDEILIIRQLGEAIPIQEDGIYRTYFREQENSRKVLAKDIAIKKVRASDLPLETEQLIASLYIDTEELAEPNLYSTLLEHLVSLGVVSYINEPMNIGALKEVMHSSIDAQVLCIKLSEFGSLFFKACVINTL